MRKLIVATMMSLDGFYTGPGGDVMVLPDYDSFDLYNAERLRAADTLLLGRTSYDGFKGFWPPMADEPDAAPTHREISESNNAIDKVVVSDTLTRTRPLPGSTTRASSRARTLARRSPSSSARTEETSSSSAAARSGSTCSPAIWSTRST